MDKKKNKGGRPTKYNREAQVFAENYINGGYISCGDAVPSRAGLAVELGISRETLTSWGKSFPEFLGTLERLLAVQERVTLSKGLSGDFNSNIAKMLLGNHGYSDSQKIDHASSDGSMSPKEPRQLSDDDLLKIIAGNGK